LEAIHDKTERIEGDGQNDISNIDIQLDSVKYIHSIAMEYFNLPLLLLYS